MRPLTLALLFVAACDSPSADPAPYGAPDLGAFQACHDDALDDLGACQGDCTDDQQACFDQGGDDCTDDAWDCLDGCSAAYDRAAERC